MSLLNQWNQIQHLSRREEDQLEEALGQFYKYPTTNDQLIQKMPTGKFLRYEELERIQTLQDLFPRGINARLLFYPNPLKDTGHWTLLLYHPEKPSIEFFDSYGLLPDDEFKYIGQGSTIRAWLINLLERIHRKNGLMIEFNPFPFQSLQTNAATCGPWCVFRYWCSQFHGMKNVQQFQYALEGMDNYQRNLVCLFMYFFLIK